MTRDTPPFPVAVPEAAAVYLARGFAAVPLLAGAKQPAERDWTKFRADRNDLSRFANRNIGLLMGEPSGGLIDVDLDCPEAVRAAELLMPDTGMIFGRASAPRSHRLYLSADRPAGCKLSDPVREPRHPDGVVLVELRSAAQQSMAPPSIHPDGEPVEWTTFADPAEVGGDEMTAAVKSVAAVALVGRYWPRGGRHDAALALAGGLLRAGWNVPRAESLMRAVCAVANDEEVRDRVAAVSATAAQLTRPDGKATGWPALARLVDPKVVDTVRLWLGATADTATRPPPPVVSPPCRAAAGCQYQPIPPYVPFPLEVMPGPWHEFCREGARVLGCDPALIALPALAALAGAVGMTRRVYLGGEWYEPAVLWTCVVAESGSLKSPAADLSAALVRAVQGRLLGEHRAAVAAHKRDVAAAERDGSEPPAEPVLRRVLVSDVTIERLAGILDDNNRGLTLIRDELAGWLGSFCKYRSGGGSDEPNWLSVHRADALVYDRKTGAKASVYVPHAAVSVVGGIQPDTLRRLLDKGLFDSGLAARLLFAMPPRSPKRYTEEGIPAAVRAAAEASLNDLYSITPETDDDGEPRPWVVRLAPVAKVVWRRFVNEWGQRQFATDGPLAAALAKLEGMAARVALVRHLVTTADTPGEPIGVADVEAGIRFVRWAANEVVRVYRLVDEQPAVTDTRKLVELVQRLATRSVTGDRVSPRDLQRSRRDRYPTVDSATAGLDSLVSLGVGDWEDPPSGKRPGRPSNPVFVLRPTSDESDIFPADLPEEDTDDGAPPSDDRDEPPTGPLPPGSDLPAVNLGPEDGSGDRGVAIAPQLSDSSDVGHSVEPSPDSPAHPFTPAFTPTGPVGHVVVSDQAGVERVEAAVRSADAVGLDTETTGLDPQTDRVRLLSVYTSAGTFVVDCFAVDPTPLFGSLAATELVGHNLLFDLQFLARLGLSPGRVWDTMLASQVLEAGDRTAKHSLLEVTRRHLGVTMDKAEQVSDWGGELTPEQLAYAAHDVGVLLPLRAALTAKLTAARLLPTVELENRALRTVAWMVAAGVGFDRPAWEALAVEATTEVSARTGELNTLAPPRSNGKAWNWNSHVQVKEAFAAVGVELTTSADAALAGVDHPLASALRAHRAASKRAGTYGTEWLRHVSDDGRVHPGWRQLGADSGRMSCSEPNVQNLPRDPRYRRCFVAPPGRVLVKADYSQIELRLAARIAKEPAMQAAYRSEKDLHTEAAKAVLNKGETTKADRQLAKAINFGLLYGMGAATLAAYARSNYGVELTEAEAAAHRGKFFATYPGLAAWHRRAGGRDGPVDTRTPLGRRRAGVTRDTEKLNTPVQGAGADGLKATLALLWERRAECPTAVPVLAVHDEIVVECEAADTDAVTAWLTRAMVDGMAPFTDPVPVVVETTVGQTWGG